MKGCEGERELYGLRLSGGGDIVRRGLPDGPGHNLARGHATELREYLKRRDGWPGSYNYPIDNLFPNSRPFPWLTA